MARNAARDTYSGATKGLHWLVVILIAVQFLIGWSMPDIGRTVPVSTLVDLHLSFGILILFVALLRFAVRALFGGPTSAPGLPAWQRQLAITVHRLLYLLLLVVPLLGWMNASWRGMMVSFFGLFDLPKLLATRVTGWGWTGDVHVFSVYVLLALVAMHTGAALYHHFIRHDRVLARMLPGI